MANLVQQVSIPLAGKGFVSRPAGGYGAGEYKRCVNMELSDDGSLRNRRNIRAIAPGANAPACSNNGEFIGTLNDDFIFAKRSTAGTITTLFGGSMEAVAQMYNADINMATLFPSAVGMKLCGYFRYNKLNYVVSLNWQAKAGSANVYEIHILTHSTPSHGATPSAATYSALPPPSVKTLVASVTAEDNYDTAMDIVKVFTFKERIWIATRDTLYFSKATDPLVWAAPDGGFFKFPDRQINDIVAIRDSIYVIMDNEIRVLTFNSNPNTDATIISISQGFGGDAGCIYQDVVYFYKGDKLYSCENNRIAKVLDLNFKFKPGQFTGNTDTVRVKMLTYYSYIIFMFRDWTCLSPLVAGGIRMFPTPTAEATNRSHVLWLNMENQFVHEYDFKDRFASFNGVDNFTAGLTSDMLQAGAEDIYNEQTLYISNVDKNANPTLQRNFFYGMLESESNVPDGDKPYDQIRNSLTGTIADLRYSIPMINIEIDSFSPDVLEYTLKKFRTLLVEASLPYDLTPDKVLLDFRYGDDQNYLPAVPLPFESTKALVPSRAPYAFRFPINQRGRSLSIRIRADQFVSATLAPVTTDGPRLLEIWDMSLMWTPTGRHPERRN